MISRIALPITFIALGISAFVTPSDARACGCFAPPDPSVPIVQAGERIIFASDGSGNVVAHIQIQYRGEPGDFGWLLPLPSVPELELGVDEVFAQAIATTQPKYRLTRVTPDSCLWGNQLANFGAVPASEGRDTDGDPSLVVKISSIGPYDYAVLRADSKDEMLNWLTENRYFIPTGTEDVVGPYIRPGAYFLALKLRSGKQAGDIQPVVLKYASDRAMIPLILTSVAADPNMGVQVWMLGDARAIPVNFRHTVLNEEWIDWFSAGANYNDVIIAATNEATAGQSFVTEYAGETTPMVGVLDWQGRFGSQAELAAISDIGLFVQKMRQVGFLIDNNAIEILKTQIEVPARLLTEGVTEEQFFQSLDYYLVYDRQNRPELYEGVDLTIDPVALASELFTRIAQPTLRAGQLFRDHPWMTRLYTTLSPEEMTRDPVFSFNRSLPAVSNIHEATFNYLCEGPQDGPGNTPGVLAIPDGRRFYVREQTAWVTRDRTGIPYSRRIELLREEGAPEIEVDNTTKVSPSEDEGAGCQCSANATPGGSLLGLAGLMLGLTIVRRRPRR